MIWPTDSYTKTQIYKLEHFLRLYHEGRCRELLDMLTTLLAVLRKVCEAQNDPVDIPLASLD